MPWSDADQGAGDSTVARLLTVATVAHIGSWLIEDPHMLVVRPSPHYDTTASSHTNRALWSQTPLHA